MVLALCEMQRASILIRVIVSIFYEDNRYTMNVSN